MMRGAKASTLTNIIRRDSDSSRASADVALKGEKESRSPENGESDGKAVSINLQAALTMDSR